MALKFLAIFLQIFSVQSSEPSLTFAGFWTLHGRRRDVLVILQVGQIRVEILGVGGRTYDVERVGIGNFVFFRINPPARSLDLDLNIDVDFFLVSNSGESYSLIVSNSGVKEQIFVYLVDKRSFQYTEKINVDQLRSTFCTNINDIEQLSSTFSVTGIDQITDINQPLYLVRGTLMIKPVGECTGVFVLIRSTGEVFPLHPMTGCGDFGTSADFFVARYTKNLPTPPNSLFVDIRSISIARGFTAIMHPSWCDPLHEAVIPRIFPGKMSSFRRFLQPRPVITHESAQSVHDKLETEYQNSLIPDKTYELFIAETEELTDVPINPPDVDGSNGQPDLPTDVPINPPGVDPNTPGVDGSNGQPDLPTDVPINPPEVDPNTPGVDPNTPGVDVTKLQIPTFNPSDDGQPDLPTDVPINPPGVDPNTPGVDGSNGQPDLPTDVPINPPDVDGSNGQPDLPIDVPINPPEVDPNTPDVDVTKLQIPTFNPSDDGQPDLPTGCSNQSTGC